MKLFWLCLVLATVVAENAPDYEYGSNELQDWDYNEFYDFDIPKNAAPDTDSSDDNSYEEVREDIAKDKDDFKSSEKEDKINDDYQIEDNRSGLKEDNMKPYELTDTEQRNKDDDQDIDDGEFKGAAELNSNEDQNVKDTPQEVVEARDDEKAEIEDVNTLNNPDDIAKENEFKSFEVNRDLEPLPLPPLADEEISKKILEETQKILNEDTNDNFSNEDIDRNEKADIDNTLEETKNILAELDDESKENKDLNGEAADDLANVLNGINKDIDKSESLSEDTLDKAENDLSEDLDKLLDTWKKLSIVEDDEKNADDTVNAENVADYEDKYGRPFREGLVLSQRNSLYEDSNEVDAGNKVEEPVNEEPIQEQVVDDMENKDEDLTIANPVDDIDDLIRKHVLQHIEENNNPLEKANNDNDLGKDAIDNNNISENDNNNQSSDESDIDSEYEEVEWKDIEKEYSHILKEIESKFNDDANEEKEDILANISTNDEVVLPPNEETDNKPVEADSDVKEEQIEYIKDAISVQEDEKALNSEQSKTMNVSNISPEQYNVLMEQFKVLHADELESDSVLNRNVGVIHIQLSVDEPVVIESPNYPGNYPSNNVIDWVLQGDGVGIELNITDFAVNGALGHYLMVKPGNDDDSGTNGIIFSFALSSPRKYRFLDVDRVFLRFASPGGMPFFRGFSISARMVSPPIQFGESAPEPEPVELVVREELTLHLGYHGPREFSRIQELFRVLIADMATMYLNANGIDHGLNTTLEAAQITHIGMCNTNWPGFESCSLVKIAVPLVYDEIDDDDNHRLNETDLRAMWEEYSVLDPFATRLRRMDISDFLAPNDNRVLGLWLLISAGMIVCIVMLALTLWRYSCFENYTRMPQFNDQDSVYNEKQGLDLYPTPHQTLPPLFGGDKFDDSTRVDMGGFTNRSFTRDELFDIDSDEDARSPRDRTNIKGAYKV